MTDICIIGAGPAGLMAAEVAAQAGARVAVYDQMPSVGRKFLMAGKSGLNLTKDEPLEDFLSRYGDLPRALSDALRGFENQAVVDWAKGLGQEVFTGSSGRVFPKMMKASPLLRAWLGRLGDLGVTVHTRHRWTGWRDGLVVFDTPAGEVVVQPKATVLALGGCSWSRLGSDGAWVQMLDGVARTPFAPSNIGVLRGWSHHMAPHFGAPIKPLAILDGEAVRHGECVLSQDGLQGSLIYEFSAAVRAGRSLTLDLMPGRGLEEIEALVAKASKGLSLTNLMRKRLNLSPVKAALLRELSPGVSRATLAQTVKALPLGPVTPAPIDQAISVAGGVAFSDLTEDLMLRSHPGVFMAGEMLDWDAPTGGYLITACLATGRLAGRAAASFVKQTKS